MFCNYENRRNLNLLYDCVFTSTGSFYSPKSLKSYGLKLFITKKVPQKCEGLLT